MSESTLQKYPEDQPPPRKFVLVISCVDYRLLDDLVRFLNHENLTNRYYHIAFAGASLCLSDAITKWPEPICVEPKFEHWRATLHDHLGSVLKLTGYKLSDVYIVEHRDCGAYEKFLGVRYYPHDGGANLSKEAADHATFAHALRDELGEWFDRHFDGIEKEQKKKQKKEKPPCADDPPAPPHIHMFLMGLRGEVERIE
jgi:hypothetical protein